MCGIATTPSSLRRSMVNQSYQPGVLDASMDNAVDEKRAVHVDAFPAVRGYKDALARDAVELLRKIAETLAERKERDVLRAVWRAEAADKGLETCGCVAVLCDLGSTSASSSVWGGDEALSAEHREALEDNLSKLGMEPVSRLDEGYFEDVLGGTHKSELVPAHVICIFPQGMRFPSGTRQLNPDIQCLANCASLFSESGVVALVLAAGKEPTRVLREDGGVSAVSAAADAFMAMIGGVGEGVCLLGDTVYHETFVNAFAAYLPNKARKNKNHALVIVNPLHEKVQVGSQATTTRDATTVTEMKLLEPSRKMNAQMRSLDDVVFTVESVKTPETQLVLIEKFETFLKDLAADSKTKFPLATSQAKSDSPLNEMKVVADFLGAGKTGAKKKKAEAMLDKLYTLRKLPRKYFIEKAAAEAAEAAASP